MSVRFEAITTSAITTLFAIARKDRNYLETIGFPEGCYNKQEIIEVLESVQEGAKTSFVKFLESPEGYPEIDGLFKMNIIHPDGKSTGAIVVRVRKGETYAEVVASELYRMCEDSLQVVSGFFVQYIPMEYGEFIKRKTYSRVFVVGKTFEGE